MNKYKEVHVIVKKKKKMSSSHRFNIIIIKCILINQLWKY